MTKITDQSAGQGEDRTSTPIKNGSIMRREKTGGAAVTADELLQRKPPSLHVDRPVYQVEELNAASSYAYQSDTFVQLCKKKLFNCAPLSCLYSTVPILEWLPRYNKTNVCGDVIAGITVAIMHIPQGMAYGLLGNLPPVVGIYMAFFPVLLYVIFGTSRHVSMGTFAVVCLMTGKVVSSLSSEEFLGNGTAIAVENKAVDGVSYTSMQVATTVTFTVALIQFVLYVFRLGVVTTLLSETLVNAFTCACAVHVVISQLKDLFGIKPFASTQSTFRLVRMVYHTSLQLPDANAAAIVTSAIFIFLLTINNEVLKPRLAKHTKIPFPVELVAVTLGTAVSYTFGLHEKYGLSIVGNIPTGLPQPALPAFALIPHLGVDAFVITMVSYAITMSMALIFAKKDRYQIDANQELFALGTSNLVGSFFSCMPVTASLSRSLIQYTVGGVTQIASIVSCLLLLVVLLYIGPVFKYLPRCVLASIIVVALKGLLLQCTVLKKYWTLSRWDAWIWIITFTTTTVVGIDVGLVVGMLSSLLTVFIQSQMPYTCLLGTVDNTDLYVDINRHKGASQIDGIKIFRYCGLLNFASKSAFESLLCTRVGVNPAAVLARSKCRDADRQSVDCSSSFEEDGATETLTLRRIIVDFSAVTYADPSAIESFRKLVSEFSQLDIRLYISGSSDPVFEMLRRCERYESGRGERFLLFPTVHDAVAYAKADIAIKSAS